jgi:hypothetical protein
LNHRNFAIGIGVIFAVLMMVAAFYALITVVFVEVNPIAVVAAISVAFAGIVWFKKTVKNA